MNRTPLPNSYWVLPNQLIAGEYPAVIGTDEASARIQSILEAGVTLFLDLTVEGEYSNKPYHPLAHTLARELGKSIQHIRLAISDMSIPKTETMHTIQRTLHDALDRGEVVYVHCFAGIGRTGTVVGCHLVERGMSGEEALAAIAHLRQNVRNSSRSPETHEQRAMVLGWKVEQ